MRAQALFFILLACTLTGCEDRTEAAVARGNHAAKAGKLADAEKAYEDALQLSPENVRALELLGNVQLEQGKLAEARKSWEGALQLRSSSVDARVGLARLDAVEDRKDAALLALTNVLRDAPDNVLALTVRASLLLGRGAREDVEAALKDTEHAVAVSPENPAALYARGNALLADKKADEARKAFEELQRVTPSSPLAPYGLARLAALQNDRLSALTQLRTSLEKAKGTPGVLTPAAIRKDPAFRFLEADPDFNALLSAP